MHKKTILHHKTFKTLYPRLSWNMLYTEMLAAFGKSHFLEFTQGKSCFGKAMHADGTNHEQRC